jgi:uncharacterized membrane protein YdcZ (DUF606 family)
MASITPGRAFKWAWIACAAIGAVLVLISVVSASEYGVAAGVILAVVWGPIIGLLASGLTWGIHKVVGP